MITGRELCAKLVLIGFVQFRVGRILGESVSFDDQEKKRSILTFSRCLVGVRGLRKLPKLPQKSPTYEQIQEEVRRRYGATVKTCWIADVKEHHGLTRGPAWNRSEMGKANPCPPRYKPMIEGVMRDLGMI
jgi:hypothetical protein